MPNDFAISVWLLFLSISNFLISAFIMVQIIQKFFTVVKKYLSMKEAEKHLKELFIKQIQKFLKEEIDGMIDKKGDFRVSLIASLMNDYYKVSDFTKQNVESYLKSPQLSFIVWLLSDCHMNLKWVLEGEKDKNIKSIKVP